ITSASTYVVYDTATAQTTLTHLIYNCEEVSQVEAGETVYFMLTETPLYAVSGGQVADTGIVYNDNIEIAVSEVTKAP
ncbi:alanine--tRNA ligase-related protein, partial [Staphylococcus aureus]|nr:alanine--tRNA ligase-related protein [Staphylococcus aureus]